MAASGVESRSRFLLSLVRMGGTIVTNSYYKIALDIHDHSSSVMLKAKRGDTSRIIYITLMDGRHPYAFDEECYAVLTGRKDDGTILYNECEIIENTIVYKFTPQTCSSVGRVACEVKLYGIDDRLLSSASFYLLVEDAIFDDDKLASRSEVSALTHLISKSTEQIRYVEHMLNTGAFVGAQGISGVTVYPEGYFALELNSATGELFCVTPDEETECPFILDDDGNLYYEIKEA